MSSTHSEGPMEARAPRYAGAGGGGGGGAQPQGSGAGVERDVELEHLLAFEAALNDPAAGDEEMEHDVWHY